MQDHNSDEIKNPITDDFDEYNREKEDPSWRAAIVVGCIFAAFLIIVIAICLQQPPTP